MNKEVAFVSIGSRVQSAINNAFGHYCHQYIVLRCFDGETETLWCVETDKVNPDSHKIQLIHDNEPHARTFSVFSS